MIPGVAATIAVCVKVAALVKPWLPAAKAAVDVVGAAKTVREAKEKKHETKGE